MESQTSKITKEVLGQIIDKYPGELADVLMEKKPYLRDLERFIMQNPNCEMMVGFKVCTGKVQVLNLTLTHKYIGGR